MDKWNNNKLNYRTTPRKPTQTNTHKLMKQKKLIIIKRIKRKKCNNSQIFCSPKYLNIYWNRQSIFFFTFLVVELFLLFAFAIRNKLKCKLNYRNVN